MDIKNSIDIEELPPRSPFQGLYYDNSRSQSDKGDEALDPYGPRGASLNGNQDCLEVAGLEQRPKDHTDNEK